MKSLEFIIYYSLFAVYCLSPSQISHKIQLHLITLYKYKCGSLDQDQQKNSALECGWLADTCHCLAVG